MTSIKLKIIIGIVLLIPLISLGQDMEGDCATHPTSDHFDYMNNTQPFRDMIDVNQYLDNIYHIPVQAHIIRRSNGTGGLDESTFEEELLKVNAAYAPVNMVFYQCNDVNYIDDDNYYNNNIGFNSTLENNLATSNNVQNVINIYFLPNTPYCGWAYFPSMSNDWIVMDNLCSDNGSTLIHEFGHYFNLYHTHQGNNSSMAELVDGSNCTTHGDEICDTPADPRLSWSTVDMNCNYLGSDTDANGDSYSPDAANIMSYSRSYCRTMLTPMQLDRVLQSYLFDRYYLDGSGCSNNPCLDDWDLLGYINSPITYIASDYIKTEEQIDNSVNTGTGVRYNAGTYVELLPNFYAQQGSLVEAYIDGCNNSLSGNLVSSSMVIPYNKDNYPKNNQQQNLELSTSLSTVHHEVDFRLFPNPFQEQTTIEYTLLHPNQIGLSVYNSVGQRVQSLVLDEYQEAGTHQYHFNRQGLSSGLYLCKLVIGDKVVTRKMMITQ